MIPGARVIYTREGDTWWAHANLHFSSAADSLPDLKMQVHAALREIFGTNVAITEITNEATGWKSEC